MIRVGYIAGEPNPSRVPHLRLLAQVEDIDLTVIYASATVHRRTWSLDVGDATVLRGPRLPTTFVLHHDYPLTPQIWRLLQRERFDCLVIGGWSLLATQLAIVWARLHDTPYLLISENHALEPRPRWVRLLKSLVLRHVVPQAAGQLVTGRLAREHQLAYGARPDRMIVWPNTVDVAAFRQRAAELRAHREELRRELGSAPDEVVVLQVSRLIPQKGPDLFVDAVARAQELTAVPLRAVLVGDGELRDAVTARAARRGVALVTTGLLEGDALLRAYSAADVFTLLSRREPWGIVVNEAAACGLPLVVSDRVGAAADLVEQGRNGMLVRAEDPDDAGRAIAALADDADRRAQFGARSLELVAGWSYEPSVEELARLIRTVTAERRSR
jgi:glycosyltransferase involved in cell wall biosynthesis